MTAYFARIVDNLVTDLQTAPDDYSGKPFPLEGEWIECDKTNVKMYPGPEWTWHPEWNQFVPPSPYPSWSLNDDHEWVAPIPEPMDGTLHYWDELQKRWMTPAAEYLPPPPKEE